MKSKVIRAIAVSTTVVICLVLLLIGYVYFRGRSRIGCPVVAWLHPIPHDTISDSDYLELRVLPGYSPYDRYVVRIWGDGRVDRTDADCPLDPRDSHAMVDPNQARRLLSSAQEGLCRLCSLYRPELNTSVSDAGVSRFTISTASGQKSVTNSAGSPPLIYVELENRADDLTGILPVVDISRFSPERTVHCEKLRRDRSPLPPPLP